MHIEMDVSQDLIDKLVSAGVLELDEVQDSQRVADALEGAIWNLPDNPSFDRETVASEKFEDKDIEEWGKQALLDCNYGNTSIQILSAGYDDFIRTETVKAAFQEYCEHNDGYASFSDYLTDNQAEMISLSISLTNILSMKCATLLEVYGRMEA